MGLTWGGESRVGRPAALYPQGWVPVNKPKVSPDLDAELNTLASARGPVSVPPTIGRATPTPMPVPSTASSGSHGSQPALGPFEPEPGTRLHHYEIIKLIGRGGMGAVYLARDTRLGRKVAIKFLRTQSDDLTRRFILEARTTAACSHENIVVIYEVDAWQGIPFLVFEYLSGQPLTKHVPHGRALPVPRAVELLVPVVRALASAHGQGIVHRDLKPDNIFVCDSGVTKVLDFGIAKVLQADERAPSMLARPRAPKPSLEGGLESADDSHDELTQKGAMMGTLEYMAPEQWGIGIPIDHRADLWSVGIMLFRMLSGRHPLEPLRGHQLMVTGMLDTPMPSLGSVAPELPPELAALVDRCLKKRKEERWPDAGALLRALEAFLPGRYAPELRLDESPYAGLAPFQEADASRFFGRAQEIAAVVNKVRERPVVALVGPSGAGKSSFVRAGVIPALKRSGENWEALVVRPGRSPLAALAGLAAPMLGTSLSVADELAEHRALEERLSTEPGFVGALLRTRARRENKNLLLFVDQFEELYTMLSNPVERRAFTASLAAIADDPTSPIRLVLSMRSDFLDRVPEDPGFMAELSQGLVFLGPPGEAGLREAIVAPAQLAGYHFDDPAIVDDMVTHLATTPGALPLLQFAATRLWDQRDAARKLLTTETYRSIGGVTGALASHADEVIGKFNAVAAQLIRAIFVRLVTPERTRAIVSLEELRELHRNPAQLQTILDELVQARLLTIQTSSGSATVEIVHESLLQSWPTLRRWLDESSEDAAFIQELRNASKMWHAKNRPEDLLWRGELALEAERFHRRYKGDLADLQRAFLEQVRALRTREARLRRVLAGAAVTISVLVAMAATIGLMVVRRARDEAQAQAAAARIAEAVALTRQEEAQEKERARAKAAEEAELKRKEAEEAQAQLFKALQDSELARKRASEAENAAGQNFAAAQAARDAAEHARLNVEQMAHKLKDSLEKEKQRVKQLEEASGSSAIDILK